MNMIGRAAIAVAVLGAATAGGTAMSTMDADGDGMLSFTEMLAAMPLLTVTAYRRIDTNADGAVDPAELAVARTAGLVPNGG